MTKILHIIPSLRRGGAERLVLDICNCLYLRPEVEIKLVCFTEENDYTELMYYNYLVVIPSSVQLSVYKKNKVNVQALSSFINNFKPDIIHTHLFEAEIISRSCYYPNAVWFSHCHDNMIQFRNFKFNTIYKKKYLTNFYEKIYLLKRYKKNGGNCFIVISNHTKIYFENCITKYKKILLPNAINFSKFFHPLRHDNIENETLTLINIGSLVDKKNQIFLIEIAKMLRTRIKKFRILVLGDGKNKKKIVENVFKNSLDKNFIFLGNVNNVEDYLRKSDIYLHTATYEPFGLVLLEAMAAGLPVITLDGKGNRDLIEHDKNGYMISKQNPELFAETIINLWNDRKKYEEMSKYAQEYAKKFDISFYVDSLLDLYKKAIEEKKNISGK